MSKQPNIETKQALIICFTKSVDVTCYQLLYSQKTGFVDGHG